MSKLKLTVNDEKTRICKVPEEEFDFLGYTFGRMHSARTGQARLGYRPSKKSIKRMEPDMQISRIRLSDKTVTPSPTAHRFDWIAASLEPARDDVSVLESLTGALPGVRQHCMRCVADELYATAAPILSEGSREKAPF
jgi:hypothetical protein